MCVCVCVCVYVCVPERACLRAYCVHVGVTVPVCFLYIRGNIGELRFFNFSTHVAENVFFQKTYMG